MRAALIATGNEIVSGQILNTNTSWLASKLSEEGLDTHFHMAVLDDKEDLLKILKWLKEEGIDHVFMSGGLGPTRDDLTREVLAEFCDKGFEFYEPRWIELEERLRGYNIVPREGHKWQCYFPAGAKHLINNVGTAWGFQTETKDKEMKIWALPGPPLEFEDVYKNSVVPWLKAHIKSKMKLVTWQCLNTPESEVAHITEEALKGCHYEVGYRASPPITEVKLWVPVDEFDENIWCEKLDKLYENILYSKNGTDFFKTLLNLYEGKRFAISDNVSNGVLIGQIKEKYPDLFNNIEYLCNSDMKIQREGMSFGYFIKEADLAHVTLSISIDQKNVEFFKEEISLVKTKNLTRAKKLALAKLIKKAALHFVSDLV